jgi:predicted RNA-binding protein YlxR (DUF448 family)
VVDRLGSSVRAPGPVRTCIGCRERAAKRELLRLVAGTDAEGQEGSWFVAPDPGGTAPGRGAHLHPTDACLALAERKRAFTRALRHDAGVRGALSLDRVRQHLAAHQHHLSTETEPIQNGSTSS